MPSKENELNEFGRRLQRLRKLKGLTQQDLANISGLDLSTIQKLEGGVSTGREETRQRLAQALRVRLSYLVYGVDGTDDTPPTITVPPNLSAEDLQLLEDYAEFLSQRRVQKDRENRGKPFPLEEALVYAQKLLRRVGFFRQRNVPTALDLKWIEEVVVPALKEQGIGRVQVFDLLEVVNKEIFEFLYPETYSKPDFSWDEIEDVNDIIARELDGDKTKP